MKKTQSRKRAALRSAQDSEGSSPGNGRAAGPTSMADPDTTWDIVAVTSDESFPCSDPPSWSTTRAGRRS
jgi:hypothetical protein